MGILVTNGDSFTYGDELPGSRRLDDEGNPLPDTHHEHTYTYKLAQKLGCKYVNLGQNGSSNQKIFRRTTTFLQNTNKDIDYLVIVWSSWGRLEVFRSIPIKEDELMYIPFETNMSQIIPNHHSGKLKFLLSRWSSEEEHKNCMNAAKAWYEHVYTMQTAIVHHLNYMRIIQEMCDLKGIKVIQGIIHHGMWHNIMNSLKTANKNAPYENEFHDFVVQSLEYLRPECKIGFGDFLDMTSIAEYHDDFFLYPIGHPCENTHTYYAEHLYKTFMDM